MATKKSDSDKRKTPATRKRKSSRKIKFDPASVSLLLGLIFLGCCFCIAFSVLDQKTTSVKKTAAPTTQITERIPETKPSQKKSTSSVPETQIKKETAQTAKVQESKKTVSEKPLETPKSMAKEPAKPAKTTAKTSVKKLEPAPSAQVASAKGEKTTKSISSSKPSEPFDVPPARNGATLVIVIDDAGLSVSNTKKYTALPFPLTIAVLPKLSHTKDCAYVVRASGKELILHQPMQSLNHNLNPGPGKITVDMSFAEIRSIVNENLAELGPGVKGLNNHEGSEVTEDVLRIGAVLDTCLENNIYFLDSRTTANTKAPQAALERDMKIFEKAGPYIDNVISREAMLKEMYKALDFANKNGKAIIIGHVDKSANILPTLLSEMYPYLIKAGYRFATPSTL